MKGLLTRLMLYDCLFLARKFRVLLVIFPKLLNNNNDDDKLFLGLAIPY